ncbi:MAG: extracellular solute-binding protein [Saprospiraceae bacterium]|nr:extracellular solute-binding protein [Saprospiraceae bacterium]
MINRCLVLEVILWLGFVLISCGRNERGNGDLIYWSANNPEEMLFAQNRIKIWNKNNPIHPITFQPVPEGSSSEEIILASVVGKTTPDIYANMWQGDVEDYALAGVLVPLDTLDGFLPFLRARCSDFVIREITSSDGHIYQIPWKANPIMMLYNPLMFSKAGFTSAPRSYDEFLTVAKEMTLDRDQNGYTDQWMGTTEVAAIWWQRFFNFLPLYIAASGGAPLVENGKAVFDNQHSVEVFEFLQEIYRNGYFPKEQAKSQSDPFLTGGIAVKFTGPWDIMQLNRFKNDSIQYDFATMPVPNSDDTLPYTYCDPKNIVIFRSCSKPEIAWKFLQTMISEDADLEFLQLSQQLPRRKDLSENTKFIQYFDENPTLKPFQRQSAHLRGMDSSPYMKEVLDLISQEYELCVVYDKKTAEQAVKDAAQAVNLLYLD